MGTGIGPDTDAVRGRDERTDSLPALLARSAGGDEAAFAEMYDVIAPRVFGVTQRVLRHRGQAEEVAQEALMTVWRTSGAYDPSRGSAMGWVLTIAHSQAVDRVRSSRASVNRDRGWASRQLDTTDGDSTADTVHEAIEAASLRAALRALTPKQRTAITLAFFGGQTHAEVATSLGIPLGTAKTRIRDGLRSLGHIMTPPVSVA